MCALVPVRVRCWLTTSNLMQPIFTRAVLTISGKSPEKFKIGIKPIISDLGSRYSGRLRGSPPTTLQKPAENSDDEVRSISYLGDRRSRNHRGFRNGRQERYRQPQIRLLEVLRYVLAVRTASSKYSMMPRRLFRLLDPGVPILSTRPGAAGLRTRRGSSPIRP